MSGINQSKITVTLRNPLDHNDLIEYYIIPDDHQLARDWVAALKKILIEKKYLEKNFCFLGFPNTPRNIDYLCDQLNQAVHQINMFNQSKVWQIAGLKSYTIEEHFSPNTVRFSDNYNISSDLDDLGLRIKHSIMNRIHNDFENLQGTVDNLSDYYKLADYNTKYAIRQLNILCHELETLILSQRKLVQNSKWMRPSQITTFLHADRYQLTEQHRELFKQNGYDRQFGHVYMHWTQIGKTLFEVFRDEHAPKLDDTICEAINHLQYYSGEFDIEWANDVVYGSTSTPWHTQLIDDFNIWLSDNNLDPNDSKLSLGHLHLGQVDLKSSFGTESVSDVWDILKNHLDLYCIEIDGIINQFDYCWTDSDYKQRQIDMMRPGYDYSSRR
jgi:hypothetical protein